MVIRMIVSGGQTGVDRAALDAARTTGVRSGGWCPKGRRAEDGTIPTQYSLQETPSEDPAQRTEWNVRDSDGTLVLTLGEPTGGTALTVETAARLGKPCLILDLTQTPRPADVLSWSSQHGIQVLNVADLPRPSLQRCIVGPSRY